MEKFISIKSGSYRLAAIIHIPDEKKVKKFPGVILCHGFSGNKAESHFIFTRLARILCRSGIVCLRFDFMGSGDSSGYFENMTLETEIMDAASTYRYLVRQPFIESGRIGILGLSMGAIPATIIASKFRLNSVCLWSPVAFPCEIRRKILTKKIKKTLDRTGSAYLSGYGLKISKKFIDSLDSIDPLSAAKNYNGYTLVIHSKDDSVIDVSHAISYYRAFHNQAQTKKLIILEKGGHTFVLEEAENKVLRETKEFFTNTLFT